MPEEEQRNNTTTTTMEPYMSRITTTPAVENKHYHPQKTSINQTIQKPPIWIPGVPGVGKRGNLGPSQGKGEKR
jgi:hypothetical protein